MPLLRKEPDMYPDGLFQLSAETFPWIVAHVRSRQEKQLARHLRDRSMAFFLPQVEQRKKRSGRTFRSFLPLFPGYVFVRGGPDVREAVWRSDVVANLIEVVDQDQLGAQLAEIRQLQLAGASLRRLEEFVPGDAVLIRDGAFKGYSGVMVREKSHDRLLISISLLRQSISVEFDRDMVGRGRSGRTVPGSRSG